MTQTVGQRYTGRSVTRSEDLRILTGRGQYIADLTLPGLAHATFLRSPFPHARITHIDVEAARQAPGVLGVFTGADIEQHVQPGQWGIVFLHQQKSIEHSVLAIDKVRLVGDLVALVVAEDRYQAEDAAELIEVDYDELPGIASAEQAFAPGAPDVFDELPGNVMAKFANDFGDIDAAFARADRVVRAHLEQHRHQNVPMECRGSVSSFDAETGQLTVWIASQGVEMVRQALSARLDLPLENVRVMTGDVGGSFGLKLGAYREDIACGVAAMQLGRPIKWIEDRFEHMTASGQAREESYDVEAAVTDEGDILGLKVDGTVDNGAYPQLGHLIGQLIMRMLPGPYKIEALGCEFTTAVTNKATLVSYRGPWAAETWVRERMVDLVARELGREPMDIRLRNVVTRDVEPLTMLTGQSLEGVTSRESLERVRELIDIPAFRQRQAAAHTEGRYLGFGCATYLESAPGPRPNALGRSLGERMPIEIVEDGTVVAYSGQMPHGQGIQTTAAQVIADQLGVRFDDVHVVVGDSDLVPAGFTGGSRSATYTGGAAFHAARAMKAKVLDLAAHLIEAAADDLEIVDGTIQVRGVPARGMTFKELATAAAEPGRLPEGVDAELRVEGSFDGGGGGWAGGTHAVIVEVDIATGLVQIERYLVVEDCGELINPAIVDGQIRGGVAQGIGAVLLERSAYGDDGQFLAATFMDYLLPTTMDVPFIEIDHLPTVPLDPEVNFRGVGEGGMIVSPAAINNAIEDALAPLGVRIYEQHLPPVRIVELIDEARPVVGRSAVAATAE